MVRKRPKLIVVLLLALTAVAIIIYLIATTEPANAPGPDDTQQTEQQNNQEQNDEPSQPEEEEPAFDKTQHSLSAASSLWVVVNKQRPLPSDYVPANLTPIGGESLRSVAASATNRLLEAARQDGVPLHVLSGYRSYQTQSSVYNSYVQRDGRAAADTYSARPGHSEHQTGLAVDLGNASGVCDLETCFGNTAGGRWLAANAYKYGFIIRYLEGKSNITGYQYEPWHLRYVGQELAAQIHAKNQTMEEFFGLPAAPTY